MSQNLDLQFRQLTFPKTEDWHRFAASIAIAPGFYTAPNVALGEQPTSCIVLSQNEIACAVAVLFTHSHECGLWVAPSHRQQGLGRMVLSKLLTIHRLQLYATVSQTNPHSGAMEHLLAAFGFRRIATAQGFRLWQWQPEGRGHGGPVQKHGICDPG